MRALLEAGCDPYLEDINGETALDMSLRGNLDEMATLLEGYMRRDTEAWSEFNSRSTCKDLEKINLGTPPDNTKSDREDAAASTES